jgi:putative ABC transport system permease protein
MIMEASHSDLRRAARVLAKSPAFTLVAVAALAVGIGGNTAIFSVVNEVLLKPLPYPEPDRLVFVARQFRDGSGDVTSIPKFNVWRRNQRVFDGIAAYDFGGPGMNLAGDGRPEQVKGIHASLDYFRVFGASPVLGRTFSPEEDAPNGPRVAVISNGLWKRRFAARRDVIGQTLLVDGEPRVIIGVLSEDFRPDPPADLWIPLQADPNSRNQGHFLRVAARLKSGVSLSAANAQMKLVGEEFRRQFPKWMGNDETVGVKPMQDVMVGSMRTALFVLFGAVGFVLLIACANVASLLLARATSRQKEIAVRTAMGASRARIIRMLLTESVLLGGVAAVVGLWIGCAGVRALLALSPAGVPRALEFANRPLWSAVLDWRVLAFTAGAAVFTGVLFGLFPALQLSNPSLSSTLKEASGRGSTAHGRQRVRAAMVVAEVALALVLVIGAVLLVRTFVGLHSVAPGFDPRNVLVLEIPMGGARFQTTAAVERFNINATQRLEALPGVLAASPAFSIPLETTSDLPFTIEGKPPKEGVYNGDELWNAIGSHYFRVMKIHLLRGREFDERDASSSAPVMIVSESFAKRYFPNEDPIGQRITTGRGLGPQFEDATRTIVGVAADVRQRSLNREPDPMMYVPMAQAPDALTRLGFSIVPAKWIVRTAGEPMRLAPWIERELTAADGQLAAAGARTLEQVMSTSTAREHFMMTLLTTFAALALGLAALGIYGVMSYSVAQRRHEIGIRMALGAARRDMLGMIVGQALRLAAAGVAIGVAGAYGLTRVIKSMLFGVQATDPATFAAVAGALVLVAALATCAPAWRATRVDPVIALRYE